MQYLKVPSSLSASTKLRLLIPGLTNIYVINITNYL